MRIPYAVIVAGLGAFAFALFAAGNPRWEFLVTNLQVFPGSEKLFAPDDRLFWRLKPNLANIACAERLPEAEYRFKVSTDGGGHRRQTAASGRTILFLGDSITFGIPVDDAETFPALVQAKLGGVQTVNAGVPGYTAYQGRVLLESWPAPPAVVVITFWPNDRSPWDHLSDPEHAELLAAERAGDFSRLRLLRLWRQVTPGTRPRLTVEEFAVEIRRMTAWCRAHNSTPVLQVWPNRAGVAVEHQEMLRRIAAEERVPVVDQVPVFQARKQRPLFTDSVHATREGYALAAETLVEALRALDGWR